MGLLLLWCSVHVAGHLLSCTGTHSHLLTHIVISLYNSYVDKRVDMCVSLGKGAIGASVGSAPLQEHHHPKPETGRGALSTPGQSSSFYHTDAANTTGTHTLSNTQHKHPCLMWEEDKWQQMGKEVEFFFLQRDLTGSNLSASTEYSCLPMTTKYPLHPGSVWVCLSECLSVWITHVYAVLKTVTSSQKQKSVMSRAYQTSRAKSSFLYIEVMLKQRVKWMHDILVLFVK